MGVFEGSGVQTSPHQLGRAQGQDQEGDEGTARELGRKTIFSMKKRAVRVVSENGGILEGKAIRLCLFCDELVN